MCHCKIHNQLYYYKNDIKGQALGNEVHYVDPDKCPDATWDNIQPNSKKYVWGFNCPIYGMLFKKDLIPDNFKDIPMYIFFDFINILNDSAKKLVVSGKFIYGCKFYTKNTEHIDCEEINNLKLFFEYYKTHENTITHKSKKYIKIQNEWNIELIDANNFLFNIGRADQKFNKLIIFTKKS